MSEQKFPTALKLWKYEVERQAARFGLHHRPIMYHLVDFEEMSEVAGRGGFPTVPHHWRYGQETIDLKQHYRYGLSVIYELVVNTEPIHGYLLECNSLIDMKSVMAHVIGHANLFDLSPYCAVQNKNILSIFGNDAQWFEEQCARHDEQKVKAFYDRALSLEHLIDIYAPFRAIAEFQEPYDEDKALERRHALQRIEPPGASGYLDQFLNPSDWIEKEKKRLKEEDHLAREKEKGTVIPPKPVRDVLGFIADHAPLEEWQRGILWMIQRASYYSAMIGRMKILHEGWASYWQERIMYQPGMLADSETVEFNNHLAHVQRKKGFNPYRLGYDLICDIKFRWDTGRHGKIWDECTDVETKDRWDEFMAYKQMKEESGENEQALLERWEEFSAFVEQFRMGKLGYPKELAERERYYRENLLPAWTRFQNAEQELADLQRRLADTERVEERLESIRILLANDNPPAHDAISIREHLFKVRRDIFLKEGREDLWSWTSDELRREIVSVQALIDFRQRYLRGEIAVPVRTIPSQWVPYIRIYPSPIRLNIGNTKIFEVMATCDDITFIDEFFTKEFCEQRKYLLAKERFMWDDSEEGIRPHYILDSRDFQRIKRRLIFNRRNSNLPVIVVQDANWKGRGELYLKHLHAGVDLEVRAGRYLGLHIAETLRRIFYLWGGERRVYLETIVTIEEEKKEWWWFGPAKAPEPEGPKMLKGNRVLISYGHSEKAGQKDFRVDALDVVEFPEPF